MSSPTFFFQNIRVALLRLRGRLGARPVGKQHGIDAAGAGGCDAVKGQPFFVKQAIERAPRQCAVAAAALAAPD